MEKQNKKVGRTSQAIEWDDQKEKEKTDELRNLISEVVNFSVKKICSKIRQFSFSFSLWIETAITQRS